MQTRAPIRIFRGVLLAAALLPPLPVLGQTCEAYYPFDGNLSDRGGGGYGGSMISRGGAAATARFADGLEGQALVLDGSASMRAFLDLSEDTCPQVTVAG